MQFRLTGLTAAAAAGAGIAVPAGAQTIDVSLTLPRLTAAEYHKPYLAVWLERPDATPTTLALLYDVGKRNNAGAKWVNNLRMWWRASGRTMTLPADGITSATRAPGTHKLSFTAGRGGMPALTPGAYTLVVEVARESGGRELVRLPFAWSASGNASAKAAGKFELGAVTLSAHR
jgi:hypothetical protein